MLIVGGGPAGAALALQLARHGGAVTLVEASRDAGRQFRGEALMPSGLDALAALELWPLPASIPQRPLHGWRFAVQGQTLFEAEEPLGSRQPCTLIDQPTLLQELGARAGAYPGMQRLSGRAVVDLLWDPSTAGAPGREPARVTGVLLSDGSKVRADLVVACDGRSSLLRQKAGLALEQERSPIDVLWFELAAPASAELARWLDGRFLTVLGDGGSFALFQSARGAIQLGWALDPGERPPAAGDWRERWAAASPAALALLLRRLPAEACSGPVRLSVQVGLAERWWRPGLLLLGDAAHPMSPLRAQGINMALRDAVVAAEHLAGAHNQEAALEAIERARRPEILTIQALQRQEGTRGERLRHSRPLRQLLAASARWIGPLLARRWSADQRQLRDGAGTITPTASLPPLSGPR